MQIPAPLFRPRRIGLWISDERTEPVLPGGQHPAAGEEGGKADHTER